LRSDVVITEMEHNDFSLSREESMVRFVFNNMSIIEVRTKEYPNWFNRVPQCVLKWF